MSTGKSTLAGKLRCLQSLLQQLGANVACEAVSEAIEQLADAHLAQPAQSVDVEKVREVIAELSNPAVLHAPYVTRCADKLTAALQEKGNG